MFLTVIAVSLLYLALSARVFLLEADMSLGLSRVSGPDLRGLVVNVRRYSPPADGLLTPSQLGLLVETAEALDSMHTNNIGTLTFRRTFAGILNRYTTSVDEYRWIRTTATPFVLGNAVNTDSATQQNAERIRMFLPRLVLRSTVFTDTLDKEALQD